MRVDVGPAVARRSDRGLREEIAGFEGLTDRERQVLALLSDGSSTKEVAAQLGIAFKTAACHRSHIMAKCGVHNTVALLRFAIRKGLIQP